MAITYLKRVVRASSPGDSLSSDGAYRLNDCKVGSTVVMSVTAAAFTYMPAVTYVSAAAEAPGGLPLLAGALQHGAQFYACRGNSALGSCKRNKSTGISDLCIHVPYVRMRWHSRPDVHSSEIQATGSGSRHIRFSYGLPEFS